MKNVPGLSVCKAAWLALLILVIPVFPAGNGLRVLYTSDSFVSFVFLCAPETYLGYRIIEDQPIITPTPLTTHSPSTGQITGIPLAEPAGGLLAAAALPSGPFGENWLAEDESELFSFTSYENGVAVFRYRDPGEELTRVSVFQAVSDGIECWMWIESDHEIPGAYVVQQCFRLSGRDNLTWRHPIAYTPRFSEFDLLNRGLTRSLTYVASDDTLKRLEPLYEMGRQAVFSRATELVEHNIRHQQTSLKQIFYTPAGVELAATLGVGVRQVQRVPHGLIAREGSNHDGACGMYWERSVMVSNVHPADCLHSYVDLGPVLPGQRKVVRGKIYIMDADLAQLLKHWQRDFDGLK